MFGKSVPLIAIVLVGLLALGASAALLTQYAQVTMTVPVEQSVIIYGGGETGIVTDTFNAIGGRTYCRPHTLDNRGHVEAPIDFTWTSSLNPDGIIVSYLKPLNFETEVSTDYPTMSIPATITVVDTGTDIEWTIDIDMTDYAAFAWGGHLGYGLVISKDGIHPAFQVHGNDGVDHAYAFGTHLYSKWGPTLQDGYNGWHTGTGGNNIPVAGIGWIDCTGDRQIVAGDYNDALPIHSDGNPDGVFTVSINKCYLGDEFYWAVQVMGQTSDTHYPVAWAMWSGDSSTFPVAEIAEDIDPYTLAMLEILDFYIVYDFNIALPPDTYSITSTVNVG